MAERAAQAATDRLIQEVRGSAELFVSPGKAPAAFVISETIMLQQLEWVEWLLPQYERFLARYADEESLGEEKVTAN